MVFGRSKKVETIIESLTPSIKPKSMFRKIVIYSIIAGTGYLAYQVYKRPEQGTVDSVAAKISTASSIDKKVELISVELAKDYNLLSPQNANALAQYGLMALQNKPSNYDPQTEYLAFIVSRNLMEQKPTLLEHLGPKAKENMATALVNSYKQNIRNGVNDAIGGIVETSKKAGEYASELKEKFFRGEQKDDVRKAQ